jgi:predicted nucleic acid-binding protein
MNIFLDANIILDLIDNDRGNVYNTKSKIIEYIKNSDTLYTSCDIFTTVFYVASKRLNYLEVIQELEKILEFVEIIPIDIKTIQSAISISKEQKHKDLEDILQYECAKNRDCKIIVTNDKNFFSKDIQIESTKYIYSNSNIAPKPSKEAQFRSILPFLVSL